MTRANTDSARTRAADAAATPALTCTNLSKRFDDRLVVDDVGFDVAAGETYGLLGPNGAGKTTTISMICALLKRNSGSVVVNGYDLDQQPAKAKATLGYVPQDLAIYPDLSGAENLGFFGRLQGLRGRNLQRRVEEVLETVGLSDRARDRAEEYSGGMKRRLNIGIGLLHEPRLLILDEPTVGVDPQSRDSILSSVGELGASGIGVLYTTHYMEEAERLCDRVGIIDRGRLVAEGTRRELVDLVGEHDWIRLSVDGRPDRVVSRLQDLPQVVTITADDHDISLEVTDGHHVLPAVIEAAATDGDRVIGVELVEPDLESVFLHLTGRALRD
ncbi:MAG: ABC transporter ATP-binding protein [Acidimicrobiia bacterium]|nr:ABC transporter ATP-binding protein [Acidimicrobiia bacterium]